MKAVTAIVFSLIWLVIIMLIGSMIVNNIDLNANTSGELVGKAADNWVTMMGMIWLALGLLAFAPLILVAMFFGGLFGAFGN